MWSKTTAALAALILIAHLCSAIIADNLKPYDGYYVYTVNHDGDDRAFNYMVKTQLEEAHTNFDFWNLRRDSSRVSVSPEMQPIFEKRLAELGVNYEKKSVREELTPSPRDVETLSNEERQEGDFFTDYPRYEEILEFMSKLVARYPNYCRMETLGKTYEGRQIQALSISENPKVRTSRVVYIQAGVHAREWVAPPTVLYLANEILKNMNRYRSILKDVELYLVPLVNIDGYIYSHTTKRCWRKNRRVFANRKCVGVDLNRNYDNHWNTTGVSQNICTDSYLGTAPASEPEIVAVSRYLQNNRNRVKVALDVHSYSYMILYPFSYTDEVNAPTHSELHSVGQRVALEIAKYRNTKYEVVQSGRWYPTSGGFDDYAYDSLGVPLAYTIELPGNSFVMPKAEMIPICKETFAGFMEFIREASNY